MSDHEVLARARRAARSLASSLRDEPGVTLVDVGVDTRGEPCVRVHVSDDPSVPPPSLPSRVAGVPVVTRHGAYQLHGDDRDVSRTTPPEGGERWST